MNNRYTIVPEYSIHIDLYYYILQSIQIYIYIVDINPDINIYQYVYIYIYNYISVISVI